jgi:hypothetical protein
VIIFKNTSFSGDFFQPFHNTMRTLLFFILFLLFGIHSAAQELTGPDRLLPGTLASFEIVPPQEASWHIVSPSWDTESHQIDTGLAKLYFSSPERGRYTVIAGIVTDGKPQLLTKTFINGEEDTPVPVPPVPVPPIPQPPIASLELWIKTQLPALVKSKNLAAETKLVAECFEQIVQRIDAENIKSVHNAQAQLHVALTGSLALASPTAVTDWTPFLTELSLRLETELGGKINDLTEVKTILQEISNVMQSLELPNGVQTPLRNIDTPNNRGQGTPNRTFRNLLTR